ncbi:MAG: hypothetical protein WCK29_04555 [archaeon]
MRTINIWALSLIILGLIVYLLALITNNEGSGYLVILFGWPLILIGLIIWIVGLFIKKK